MPSITVLLGLIAVPLLALAAVRWQRALLMALPFLVTFNRLTIPLAGVSLRMDQIAACLLLVPLGASILLGVRRFRTDGTMWWLAAILTLNLLASVLHSPARTYSLTQCANLASVWVIYVVLVNFLDGRAELDAFLRCVLWAAIVASGIAVIAFMLAVSGVPVGGAEVSASAVQSLTAAYGAYGTMVEPNILGSFTAAHLVLAVALLITATPASLTKGETGLLRAVAAFAAAALVLSFTRGAWLGAIAGLLCFAVFGMWTIAVRLPVRRIMSFLAVAVALVTVALLLPGDAGTLFRFKLFNLVNLGSQTAIVRLFAYTTALQQTVDHPIVGWGTFTFAPLVAQGSDFQQFDNWRNLWIGNYLLLAAHDTGLVGLGLWVGMLATLVGRSVATIRALASTDPIVASRILALTAAVATLLVAFLATSGFSLGYSWLIMGLLGAYRRVAAERLPSSSEAPSSTPADA